VNARLLALLPAAIAINLVIGGLVNALGLPLYLDSIGTILATVLAGPAIGVLAGAIGQLLFGLINGYQWIPFGLIGRHRRPCRSCRLGQASSATGRAWRGASHRPGCRALSLSSATSVQGVTAAGTRSSPSCGSG
jgi:hypothetical protein